MKRLPFAGILMLVATFTMGCTMTSDECKSKYSLIDNSKAGCLAAYPELTEPQSPTPGPKIIVTRTESNPLVWSVDSGGGPVDQTPASQTAFDTGKLRKDFVGTKLTDFSVYQASTLYANANHVVIETKVSGEQYTIEIVRTAGDVVRWYVTKNGTRKKLEPTDVFTPGEVPLEFTGELVSFQEVVEGTPIDKIDFFRVSM